MSGERPLDHALSHNTWATGALIAFVRALEPSKRAIAGPGTYGSIERTLHHFIRSQQWYVQLLTGEVIGTPVPHQAAQPSLDTLAAVAKATGDRAAEVAANDDAGRRIDMDEGRKSTVGVILAQLVHHANEHRTQITTILGANGIEPPPLSGWAYGRAAGISEAEE